LAPTRELAFQISDQFVALGATIGLQVCMFFSKFEEKFANFFEATIVGGIDMSTQTLSLSKRPHVIVG